MTENEKYRMENYFKDLFSLELIILTISFYILHL